LSTNKYHFYQARIISDHAVIVKSKDQKESEIEHKWSEILARERHKRDRIVGVDRAQHLLDLENCRRNSVREWQSACNGLEQQLGLLQKQVVVLEMREVRRHKTAEVQEEEYRLVVQRVRAAETVRANSLSLVLECFDLMVCFFLLFFQFVHLLFLSS
jgi:hypothetical protein